MKNDFYFLTGIFSFLAAIIFSSWTSIGISWVFFFLLIGFAIFLFRRVAVSDTQAKQQLLFLVILFVCFGIGVLRFAFANARAADSADVRVDTHIVAEGIVSDTPDRRTAGEMLTVSLSNFIESSTTIPTHAIVLVSTGLYPEFHYGDLVRISGTLKYPDFVATSTTGSIFDYAAYLKLRGIRYTMSFAPVSLESAGHGNPIVATLFSLRDSFISQINQLLPEPESSLAAGILLGAKSAIDAKVVADFRAAGLSHILVLSGYNITVVASALVAFFAFLPRIAASSFGMLGIILFVLASGASSTALRAGIMAAIAMLSRMTYRPYRVGRAFLAAIIILVFLNPNILLFDLSFQLSCLATAAILYLSPLIEGKCFFITARFGLRNMIATTVSAELAVAPLILYQMGSFSLVGVPANIFVLLLMPVTMLFCFIVGALGAVSSIIVLPFVWITWILLAYILSVAHFFAGLPFALLSTSWFSFSCMLLCYAVLIGWIFFERSKKKI